MSFLYFQCMQCLCYLYLVMKCQFFYSHIFVVLQCYKQGLYLTFINKYKSMKCYVIYPPCMSTYIVQLYSFWLKYWKKPIITMLTSFQPIVITLPSYQSFFSIKFICSINAYSAGCRILKNDIILLHFYFKLAQDMTLNLKKLEVLSNYLIRNFIFHYYINIKLKFNPKNIIYNLTLKWSYSCIFKIPIQIIYPLRALVDSMVVCVHNQIKTYI